MEDSYDFSETSTYNHLNKFDHFNRIVNVVFIQIALVMISYCITTRGHYPAIDNPPDEHKLSVNLLQKSYNNLHHIRSVHESLTVLWDHVTITEHRCRLCFLFLSRVALRLCAVWDSAWRPPRAPSAVWWRSPLDPYQGWAALPPITPRAQPDPIS